MTIDTVSDNPARSRFELTVDGHTAFATYRHDGAILVIGHVEAPPPLRGTGAAGRLMQGVAETARARGQVIRPLCSYAAAWLRRHPEFGDVVE